MPILKDVVGVFGCIDASGSYLKSRLQRRKGSVVLYVGGMVELFYASPKKETVFLKQRKGFVKLALRTGADLVPRLPLREHHFTRGFKMAHPGQNLAQDGRVLHAVLGAVVPAATEKSEINVRARPAFRTAPHRASFR